MSPKQAVNKQEKLKDSREFKEIYARGHRLSGPHLTIHHKPNHLQINRLGLSTSKKQFKLSVQRHYIQRCLREAYRLNKDRFLPGHDIVISARRWEKGKLHFREIKDELLFLAQKAKLLKAEYGQ
ncbi:MAG: ribonuclease P protein component [Omnitrophica bacterium]|nr:ribonuclease P protein component [Candidatus Omnitrophota bacterium]